VRPRALSRVGRWRLAASVLRSLGLAAAAGAVAWGAWVIVASLQENPKTMPAAARAVPVKHLVLKSDGVLDGVWLARTLALSKNASLMELDLEGLRARLLTGGQVKAASLTRNFPDTLQVRVSERPPVVRVRARFGATDERVLLVARDGTVFEGEGFNPEYLATLPWLAGVSLNRKDGRFAAIAGMDLVADLLARAQLETPRLYQSWGIVSLARFEEDAIIEVLTKSGVSVIFGGKGDLFMQLAKLDYELDALANAPAPAIKIDLSLGREVPVTFAPVATTHGGTTTKKPSQLPAKREL
jgi:POTRA domain-containing FtsQ-type protein